MFIYRLGSNINCFSAMSETLENAFTNKDFDITQIDVFLKFDRPIDIYFF